MCKWEFDRPFGSVELRDVESKNRSAVCRFKEQLLQTNNLELYILRWIGAVFGDTEVYGSIESTQQSIDSSQVVRSQVLRFPEIIRDTVREVFDYRLKHTFEQSPDQRRCFMAWLYEGKEKIPCCQAGDASDSGEEMWEPDDNITDSSFEEHTISPPFLYA